MKDRPSVRAKDFHQDVSLLAREMGPGNGLCGGCEIYAKKLKAILDRYPPPREITSNIPLEDMLDGIQLQFDLDGQEMVVKEGTAVCVYGDGETETTVAGLRAMAKAATAGQKLIKAMRAEIGAKREGEGD